MVICLERGADVHTAQPMPLPLTVSCFSNIQIGFTFLVPAHPGSPGQRAVKRVCVCVCDMNYILLTADRPVGVAQLDDRQLPARGIVHAQSPCFCSVSPALAAPRCYCIANFTYIQSQQPAPPPPPLHGVNALASSERLLARTYRGLKLLRTLAVSVLYIG